MQLLWIYIHCLPMKIFSLKNREVILPLGE